MTPDLDASSDAELKRFAKAFQEFDKLFASVQVYADYEQEDILKEIGLSLEDIENFSDNTKMLSKNSADGERKTRE